jgi:hypothetical protein
MNDWHTKDRSETAHNRLSSRKTPEGIIVENPALGINLYKNAISKDNCINIINTLEENLGDEKAFDWQPAMVTEADTPETSARNCVDFKIGKQFKTLGAESEENKDLYAAHQLAFDSIFPISQDYGRYWGVGVNYFESFNFVKYDGPGTHFKIHADHGPAYVCTVSIVAYLNDDYEGGEIYFPRFDLTIKPEPGDVVIFPSTYIYEHASQPMVSGKKYSIVVMTDYNDRGNLRYHPYRQEGEKVIY